MRSVLLKYIASSGREYNLKTDGIRTKTANYHKWNWGADGTALQFGTRVGWFTRDAATYETRLIFNRSYAENKALIEALHDDFELDVRNMKTGRIVWGDYYIDCYILSSSTFPDANNIWTDNDLTIYCPYPFWIKEEFKSFSAEADPESESTFLDYPFDYDYDYYKGDSGTAEWVRTHPFASHFKMDVFGPVTNPAVYINGHEYGLYGTIEAGEYVTIDSRAHTVVKTQVNGNKVNMFDLRNKESSIFELIPPGSLEILWSGAFGFDLTIYAERSEPAWS